eukprot:COSAG04_NODE_11684_length_694_cov_1.058824_2_plen_39_part_01
MSAPVEGVVNGLGLLYGSCAFNSRYSFAHACLITRTAPY